MNLRAKDKREILRIAEERGGGQTGLTVDNRPIGKRIKERKPVDDDKVRSKPGRNIYIKDNKMRIKDGWVLPFNWEKR